MKKVCLAILIVLVAGGCALPIEPEQQYPWVYSGKYQGDMVLQPDQILFQGVVNETLRWPNGIMYYQLDPSLTDEEKSIVMQAIEHFHTSTCMEIVPRTFQSNYVEIGKRDDKSCYSEIGMTGKRQMLNLGAGAGCFYKRTVVHELLHAFGFGHQHSDPLRDNYITVYYDNVDYVKNPNARENLDVYAKGDVTDFGEGYDYSSIMHYPSNAFAKPNLKTIVPKVDVAIGLGTGLSRKDIIKLHKMYNKCTN